MISFHCLKRFMLALAAFPMLTSAVSYAQASAPAASAPAAPPCQALAESSVSLNATVEAQVTGLDSAHLKADKEIWFKVSRGIIYPSCTLEADSVVYARVVTATSSKGPGPSELSLQFDRADCSGHEKQKINLRLIAILGPPGDSHKMHVDMPTKVAGKGRQIDDAVAGTNALDMDLNPGGAPHTVHPGIVVGAPKLKLEPTAGQGCSDKISSTDNKVQLAPGSEFVLALTELR